jgi:hypothetical protein
MNTDTIFQLIDRAAIARLKAFHYESEDRVQEAKRAKEEADKLSVSGDILLYEVSKGMCKIPVHFHLRYHNHGEMERTDLLPDGVKATVFNVAGELALTHAKYWQLQTEVNGIKSEMRPLDQSGMRTLDENDRLAILRSRFVSLQCQIDLCNQKRNELIQLGDHLLQAMTNG